MHNLIVTIPQSCRKREPTLAVDLETWEKIMKRNLALCALKDALCKACNFNSQFTRNCKPGKNKVNIVNFLKPMF